MTELFRWSRQAEFLDRTEELRVLERWWAGEERMPVNLHGRRRVGKSWLFRRFAHGKPAVLLVATKLSPGAQLRSFADELEQFLGIRPDLPDLPSLLRVLYRASRTERILVVIDEFPLLLPGTEAENNRVLTQMAAVMEQERDTSDLKLIVCGSQVSQMEALQSERNPLHGRLQPLTLRPLPFREAALFLPHLTELARFERFSITGGMPRYLSALAGPHLRATLCEEVLDRNSALWDEPRVVLEQELRDAKTYFAILSALATGDKDMDKLAEQSRVAGSSLPRYLDTLRSLRLVRRKLPVGAPESSRQGHWRLEDPFFRFWFRFVFPYQDSLENGLRAEDLFDGQIAPVLPDHVAPVFEDWCREWTREHYGSRAQQVGSWWGPSLNVLRRTGERQTEELDIVGLGRGGVTVVGEVKWRNRRLSEAVLDDLERFKIPALRQAGLDVVAGVQILLASKSGYTPRLIELAAARDDVVLVDVPAALAASHSYPSPDSLAGNVTQPSGPGKNEGSVHRRRVNHGS